MNDTREQTAQRAARGAGLIYMTSVVVYACNMAIVPNLQPSGDLETVARNGASLEPLHRLALTTLPIGMLTMITSGRVLFIIIKPQKPRLAILGLLCKMLAALLTGVTAVICFIALKNDTFIADEGWRAMLGRLLGSGITASFVVATLCSSVAAAILFYTLCKQNYIPALLAGFGMCSCALALVFSFALLAFPAQSSALGSWGWGPLIIAEALAALWVLASQPPSARYVVPG